MKGYPGVVAVVAAMVFAGGAAGQTGTPDQAPLTMAEVLAAAPDGDWRAPDAENTVYFEFGSGRVVIELAPAFAPDHARNIRALVRAGYFDGASVVRSQDNYVAQWSVAPMEEGAWPPEGVAATLQAEFELPAAGLPFTPVPDGDVYAPEAGFTLGFPVARDPRSGTTWGVHCYGMVGVARGNDPDSGSGASLYAVTGHSPRHLDRNITVVGRVIVGMEHLTTLPRGTGNLGFYEAPQEPMPIAAARLGTQLDGAALPDLQLLRTESSSFEAVIQARRNRREAFFVNPADRVEVCNVTLPIRVAGS